jgi:hypothetical protein
MAFLANHSTARVYLIGCSIVFLRSTQISIHLICNLNQENKSLLVTKVTKIDVRMQEGDVTISYQGYQDWRNDGRRWESSSPRRMKSLFFVELSEVRFLKIDEDPSQAYFLLNSSCFCVERETYIVLLASEIVNLICSFNPR